MGELTVAVIGTAGRDKDRVYDLDLWCKMWDDACKRFTEGKAYHLVSGGAPWADHLAVSLYLAGKVKKLTLHFPCDFDRSKYVFRDLMTTSKSGRTENYYHDRFTQATGIHARREIAEALETTDCGYSLQPPASGYGGMYARNVLVARDVEACLAYTWGEGKEPADGGTKFTWDKIEGRKVHVSLVSLAMP